MKVHSGEKPYQCIDSSKSFNRKSDLINYTRTHTGEKTFHCYSRSIIVCNCGKGENNKVT